MTIPEDFDERALDTYFDCIHHFDMSGHEAMREVLLEAAPHFWQEGLKAGWEASCEGHNGEYFPVENLDIPNPYIPQRDE